MLFSNWVADNLEPALLGGAGGILLEFGMDVDIIEDDIGFDDDVVVEYNIPLPLFCKDDFTGIEL